jgi:hypothetical protein
MTALDKYTLAVSQRKSRSGSVTNLAILAQLEDKDVPLLIEIISVMQFGLRKIHEEDSEGRDGETDDMVAGKILARVEELAASGCSARFGGHECDPKKN